MKVIKELKIVKFVIEFISWKKNNLKMFKVFSSFIGWTRGTTRSLFRLAQIAIFALIFVIILDIIILLLPYEPDERIFGQFGDFLGGTLNPILTFLTFMALLTTIILQQKELKLTRKELSLSSQALREQADSYKKQQFESTFFSILDQHNKILSELSINETHKSLFTTNESLSKCYSRFKTIDKDQVNKYFRVLYQLLKFIFINVPSKHIGTSFDEDGLKKRPVSSEEKLYSNLVRSILSNEIIQLLAINCFSNSNYKGYHEYKLMLQRYSFLEHMKFEIKYSNGLSGYNYIIKKSLIDTYNHYGDEAFGKSTEVLKSNVQKQLMIKKYIASREDV
jgi:hypothetical protein